MAPSHSVVGAEKCVCGVSDGNPIEAGPKVWLEGGHVDLGRHQTVGADVAQAIDDPLVVVGQLHHRHGAVEGLAQLDGVVQGLLDTGPWGEAGPRHQDDSVEQACRAWGKMQTIFTFNASNRRRDLIFEVKGIFIMNGCNNEPKRTQDMQLPRTL